ncbi:MAG: nuclear transport factor 2 family protein [Rhodococcus sp. (in: high G+C Gram-positive bacteria)]|uniref:nuclear transport factor 2 family protein n=1 Tax=Rhodococcus sp. TaxID=1831 RepID=UPI003BB78917
MDLDAVNAIERIKYRYARTLDLKEWGAFADTMIPDATAVYGEHVSFESRDAFVGFLANTLGTHVVTEHHCSHPEIDFAADGRSATGMWLLANTVVVPEDGMLLRGSSYYHDRYVLCDDGQWRISHTSYERNWETVVSLDDMPSFRITLNHSDLLEVPRAS